MLKHVRDSGGRRQRGRALLLAFFLGGSFAACDSGDPEYPVQKVILRLIPEATEVSRDGAYLFVLTELTNESAGHAIVRVEAKGATLSAVPGQGLCASKIAQPLPPSTGADDDEKTFDSGTLVIADSELLTDTIRKNVKATGMVVSIPPGDEDVLLVASAYGHTQAADSCVGRDLGLIAVGSVRIVREADDDGAAGGNNTGSGGAPDSGSGGDSGSAGSPDAVGGAPSGGASGTGASSGASGGDSGAGGGGGSAGSDGGTSSGTSGGGEGGT